MTPGTLTLPGTGTATLEVNGGGSEAGGGTHELGLDTLWRRFNAEVERKRVRRELEESWRMRGRR